MAELKLEVARPAICAPSRLATFGCSHKKLSLKSRRKAADDLLDVVMPQKGGFTAMLQAYFDESERNDGTFAVAGFAYNKVQAKKCRLEWDHLFENYGGCHMSELAHAQHGTGRFKGVSTTESGRLLHQAVAIINARAKFAVAVSCNIREMRGLLPKWIRGFEGAYPVCCHIAMTAMGDLVGHHEEIAYFFESGHAHQKYAHKFMSRVLDVPDLKDSYRHYSHTFASDQDVTQLQTADLLAWEWTKYWDETAMKRERKMRKSLAALLTKGSMTVGDYDTKRVMVTHITGVPLKNFCEQVAKLGFLQLEELE